MTVEYGPIIDYARVENAIRDQVILPWIDSYLVIVERENSLTPRVIARPRSWRVLDDIRMTPEKNLPLIAVVSSGELAPPEDDGEHVLSSLIGIGVAVAVKDADRDRTRILARRYGAAVATLIDHQLGDAGGVRLASSPVQRFDERLNISTPRPFHMALAYVTFNVQVEGIRDRTGGPEQPFPIPPPHCRSTRPIPPTRPRTSPSPRSESP
jgi:hypothetical protein